MRIIKKKGLLPAIALAATTVAYSGASFGSIIFDSTQNSTGTGFGTQDNILTLNSPGGPAGDASDTEAGKVAWNGVAGTDVYTGPDVDSNPGKTATFSFGELGITDAGQILLIWNPNEAGSVAGQATQIDTLILSIYAPLLDQSVVFSDSLAAPVFHDSLTNPGIGGDDFSYVLDAAGIAALNAVLSGLGDFSAYRIGLEASVSYVDAGPDTWTIGSRPYTPPSVPEPGTLGLFGISLAALGLAKRRSRKS